MDSVEQLKGIIYDNLPEIQGNESGLVYKRVVRGNYIVLIIYY